MVLLTARGSGDLCGILFPHTTHVLPEAVGCVQEHDLPKREGSSAGRRFLFLLEPIMRNLNCSLCVLDMCVFH